MLTIILDDDRSLASYNIDNYSIIVIVELPHGEAKTRRTAVLWVNDTFEVYLDTNDESNEDDIDNDDAEDNTKTGEYPLCNEIGTYSTNCENNNCEDREMLYI